MISDYTTLRDLHRLDRLRGQPKHYAFSDQGSPFVQIPFEGIPQLPVVLLTGMSEPGDAASPHITMVVGRGLQLGRRRHHLQYRRCRN